MYSSSPISVEDRDAAVVVRGAFQDADSTRAVLGDWAVLGDSRPCLDPEVAIAVDIIRDAAHNAAHDAYIVTRRSGVTFRQPLTFKCDGGGQVHTHPHPTEVLFRGKAWRSIEGLGRTAPLTKTRSRLTIVGVLVNGDGAIGIRHVPVQSRFDHGDKAEYTAALHEVRACLARVWRVRQLELMDGLGRTLERAWRAGQFDMLDGLSKTLERALAAGQ